MGLVMPQPSSHLAPECGSGDAAVCRGTAWCLWPRQCMVLPLGRHLTGSDAHHPAESCWCQARHREGPRATAMGPLAPPWGAAQRLDSGFDLICHRHCLRVCVTMPVSADQSETTVTFISGWHSGENAGSLTWNLCPWCPSNCLRGENHWKLDASLPGDQPRAGSELRPGASLWPTAQFSVVELPP